MKIAPGIMNVYKIYITMVGISHRLRISFENEDLASERIVYTDFVVELAQELLERTGYLGESVDSRSLELSRTWEEELRDPMNAERVLEEYRQWAREWRPWELELHRGEGLWIAAGYEEEFASILSRFDFLDASSLPSAKIISPILHDPENYDEIIGSLSTIEQDEAKRRCFQCGKIAF